MEGEWYVVGGCTAGNGSNIDQHFACSRARVRERDVLAWKYTHANKQGWDRRGCSPLADEKSVTV